jgi:hypothetical protein
MASTPVTASILALVTVQIAIWGWVLQPKSPQYQVFLVVTHHKTGTWLTSASAKQLSMGIVYVIDRT